MLSAIVCIKFIYCSFVLRHKDHEFYIPEINFSDSLLHVCFGRMLHEIRSKARFVPGLTHFRTVRSSIYYHQQSFNRQCSYPYSLVPCQFRKHQNSFAPPILRNNEIHGYMVHH
jgi:hypothetical protein